jgi:hypothetical protein
VKDFSTIFSEAWSLYKERFGTNMQIGFLIYFLPALILSGGATTYRTLNPENLGAIGLEVAASIIVGIFSLLYTFTLIKHYSQQMAGAKPVSVGDAIRNGLPYLGKGIGLAIILSVALIVLFILLIIPGIIFAIFWSFAYLAFVMDNTGIIESMKKSMAVVKGKWWRTFGFMLLFGLTLVGIFLVAMIGVGIVGIGLTMANALAGALFMMIAQTILSVIVTPFSIAFMAVFYVDMKQDSEGGQAIPNKAEPVRQTKKTVNKK